MKIATLILLIAFQVQTENSRFDVIVDGRRVGTEEFSISKTGDGFIARGRTRLDVEGTRIDVQSRMELDANLNPLSYEYRSGSDTIRVNIGQAVTEIEYVVDGERTPYDIRFPAGGMIVDDNFFHHYLLLLYRAQGSDVPIPVFVPQQLTLGQLEVRSTGPRTYELSTENLQLNATTDGDGRLIRLSVAGSNVVVER